ncbi:hypothetical protein ACWGIA_37585 [Streptomyces bobili]
MYDQQGGHELALTELRRRLADGLAQARLNQTQLAARAKLGRTTVWEALFSRKPVPPSAGTVAALAGVLKLPMPELLELQRTAAEGVGTVTTAGPGRPIGEWDPHDLEVHPAGPGRPASLSDAPAVRVLPGYVRRAHDLVLADAVREAVAGHSRIVLLVGTSSTGKTRACWEAVQPLAGQGWRLWHPFDPTRAQAALEDLHRVGPRTVVWLNEAQHYFGDRAVGEQVAAAVHHLLVSRERGPVLVLGTLWPEYAQQYTSLPSPAAKDPHSRVRELLSGRTLAVPDAFDAQALAEAAALAVGGDHLLGAAITRAHADGRVTQDLAGAPELLNRYQHASPAAKALLEAAMDARRLGVGLHLPQAFLTDAATDYLTDTDYDHLTDDWVEQAYAELAKPVHGKQAPLHRTASRPRRRPPTPTTAAGVVAPPLAGPQLRLADYLEQHGRVTRRHLCPPASFWHAAYTHLARPEDLANLTQAAGARHRLQWAHHLRHRAADSGDTNALTYLAEMRNMGGDREGAEALFRQAADRGDTKALTRLAEMRNMGGDREGAEALFRQAADRGESEGLYGLAVMREEVGDREGAEALACQAVDYGDHFALVHLAVMREEAGDREGAEAAFRQSADRGDTDSLDRLVQMREEAGDRQGAEALLLQAADRGDPFAMHGLMVMREEAGDREDAAALACQAADCGDTGTLNRLAQMRKEAGDRESAEGLLRQAADRGNTEGLDLLAQMREEAGDRKGAEALLRQAADRGNTEALDLLTQMREKAGDREGAEALAHQAADRGKTNTLDLLTQMREKAGDREGAEALAHQAAAHGNIFTLYFLAVKRKGAGDRQGAEGLFRQAANHGNPMALCDLAVMREEVGDREGAEALARQAAAHGNALAFSVMMPALLHRLWPHGLDPDGMPTPPWQP